MDLGTKYGERTLTKSRTAEEMKQHVELQWFYKHGPQKNQIQPWVISTCTANIYNTTQHSFEPTSIQIIQQNRPDIAKNGFLKMIGDKLEKGDKNVTVEKKIERASLFSNLARGRNK